MRWNTARVKASAAQAEKDWNAKMEKERETPGLMARVTTRGTRGERPQGTKDGEV